MPPLVELEIPALPPYVGVVRLALASLARAAGFEAEAVEDLKIVVSEACANAVLASEGAGSNESVHVAWFEEPDNVVIEFGDRGRADPGAASDAADSEGISSRATMSLALMETLVDSCEFVPRSGGGTTTRLVIARPPS